MRLHDEIFGADADEATPDLVMLHGWGMHGAVWHATARALAATRRVTVVDLPGHGRSDDMIEPWTLTRVADAVEPWLTPGCTLLGWSLGALIAIELAARHADRVDRLVLVAGTTQFTRDGDWPHGIDAAVLDGFAARLHDDPQATIRRFLALQVRGSEDERVTLARLKSVFTDSLAARPAALAGGLDVLRHATLHHRLAALTMPVTLIHGARDTLIPPAAATAIADHLSQASLHVIDGAGHAPFLSHEAAFVDLVRENP